jgi:hypothetical protein
MSEERETYFPPESRRRFDDVIRPIVQQLLGRNGRARPMGHHRNMRRSYLLQFLSSIWGDSSGRELVRVRGQGFQTFGKKWEEEDDLFSFKISLFFK